MGMIRAVLVCDGDLAWLAGNHGLPLIASETFPDERRGCRLGWAHVDLGRYPLQPGIWDLLGPALQRAMAITTAGEARVRRRHELRLIDERQPPGHVGVDLLALRAMAPGLDFIGVAPAQNQSGG